MGKLIISEHLILDDKHDFNSIRFIVLTEKHKLLYKPFWPLLILTGVTVARARTLLLAALGLCRGAIEVSVGPNGSVILHRGEKSCDLFSQEAGRAEEESLEKSRRGRVAGEESPGKSC